MNLQIIQDGSGNNAGVFIPMDDWNLIESTYPGISDFSSELPQWQKDLIDTRLAAIQSSPERIKPIDGLFKALNKKD